MIEVIGQRSKGILANLSRRMRKSVYIDQLFSTLFYRVMRFLTIPFFGWRKINTSWCEIQLNKGYCALPNGKYCSQACSEGVGLSTQCPEGYQPSHSWGYRVTGCWCDTFRGSSLVCCDCTLVTNSPYRASAADCGCMHVLDR